jgi:hypothetical protein
MDSLVLSSLLFNTAGIAAFALAMALSYCRPAHRRPRQWVVADAAAPRALVAAQPAAAAREEAELAHAA